MLSYSKGVATAPQLLSADSETPVGFVKFLPVVLVTISRCSILRARFMGLENRMYTLVRLNCVSITKLRMDVRGVASPQPQRLRVMSVC